MTGRPEPRGVLYVHSDIPAGVTITEWRRGRAADPAAGRRPRRALWLWPASAQNDRNRRHRRADRCDGGTASK
jgi:hypothetical protein